MFFSNDMNLWVKAVKAIHGSHGCLDVPKSTVMGTWVNIIQDYIWLNKKVLLCIFCKRGWGIVVTPIFRKRLS